MRARAAGLALLYLASCGDDDGSTRAVDAAVPTDAGSAVSDASLDAGAPARLSQSGLYADVAGDKLASDVRAFVPQGVLWSDGASKRRWVYLPPGTKIDNKDMDGWILPVGTKLWKEFALDGKRLETRLLEKTGKDTWTMVAFAWLDDQSDALAVPDGRDNAQGTTHDIPSTKTCEKCHEGVADTAIGFSALQLSHADAQLTLDQLVSEQRLTVAPTAPLVVPGTPEQRDALVYLHANCANCHNERTLISNVVDTNYQLKHNELASVEATRSYRTIKRDLEAARGDVNKAKVLVRMEFRGAQGQMPPVASEIVDPVGLAEVRALVTGWAPDAGAASPVDSGMDSGTN